MNQKTVRLLKGYSAKAGVDFKWLKKEYLGYNHKERGEFIKEIMWVDYQLDKLQTEKGGEKDE